jgi:tripartite-type tricarboxylate transporter receptor subunit TctC
MLDCALFSGTPALGGAMSGSRLAITAGVLLSVLPGSSVFAQSVAEFYAGKQIRMIIRSEAGGGYDTYARLLGRHIGSHVPGQPSVVAVNMPGAGGLKAANYVANVAPKDGTILTITSQGLPMYQVLDGNNLQGDMRTFNWIGNMSSSNQILVTWHTAPVKTIEDARKSKSVIAATSGGSIEVQLPTAYNYLLGTKFEIIQGYNSGTEINLAMERGEVEGRGTNPWASYKSTKPDWVADEKLNYIIQVGLKKEDDLPQVPLLTELVKGDLEKEDIARFLTLNVMVGRPFATTPGVPKDRVAALRKAYDDTILDAGFEADATKLRAEVNSMSGEELQSIIEQIVNTPKPLLEKVKLAIESR